MAAMIKKSEEGMELDPFRALREWMRWDPFREMAPMLGRFETPTWSPSFEVRETKEGYVFRADVPGMKAEDIEINLTGNRLQFSGKRDAEKETKEDTYYCYERSYGSFTRVFTLPDGSDSEHIRTELKDGVLTVVIPKRAEAQPKKIEVKAGTPKS